MTGKHVTTRGRVRRRWSRRVALFATIGALALSTAACFGPPGAGGGGGRGSLLIDPPNTFLLDPPRGLGNAELFLVGNGGNGPSGPLAVAIDGYNSGVGFFVTWYDDCSGVSLAPGEICFVGVEYVNDTGAGDRHALLFVAGTNAPYAYTNLNGQGVPGGLEPYPDFASFTDTPGGPGTIETFDILNSSLNSRAVTPNAAYTGGPGGFAVVASNCPAQLASGASCEIDVQYTNDTGGGTTTGQLQLENPGYFADLEGTGLP